MFWACAQTETHRERLAIHTLGLLGFMVYCPRIESKRTMPTGRAEVAVPLFPGYLFVWITAQWWSVRWSPGVTRLVLGAGGEPAHVSDQIIKDLQAREIGGLIRLPPPPKLCHGDRVSLIRGPFEGHLAIYNSMKPRERVEVLLQVLGSVQRLELPERDIKKVGLS
jgi:transcriptional antiterminator RfaH